MKYQLYVGNVGRVSEHSNKQEAIKEFGEWVAISRSGLGKAGHEDVTLYEYGEVIREYTAPKI
jgi:hypothetical protein